MKHKFVRQFPHTHIMINFDLGLVLCIKSRSSSMDWEKVLEAEVKVAQAGALGKNQIKTRFRK